MLKTVNDLVTKLNALAVRIANEFRLVKADIKQLKTQGTGSTGASEYYTEIGEVPFELNGYPFSPRIIFKKKFESTPHVTLCFEMNQALTTRFPTWNLKVDKDGFQARTTGGNADFSRCTYQATGKLAAGQ